MTWMDAHDYCTGLGADLLSIHSYEAQQEAMALCDTVDLTGLLGCWIGLHRDESGDWVWSDASSSDYGFEGGETSDGYPWISFDGGETWQPDGWDGEGCVHLVHWITSNITTFEWNDNMCDGPGNAYPICKGSPCFI